MNVHFEIADSAWRWESYRENRRQGAYKTTYISIGIFHFLISRQLKT